MASEAAVLLQAVIDEPDRDEPRRRYADRCGDARRAEMILCQLEARALLRSGSRDWATAATRANQLIHEDGERWAGAIIGMVASYTFHRGFVAQVGIDAASFVSSAPDLLARAPIRHLDLHDTAAVAHELFSMPALEQIASLNLSRNGLDDEHAMALSESEHLAELAWLSLSFNKVDRAGVEAMARSEGLSGLVYVNLNGNPSGNLREDIAVDGMSGDTSSAEPSKLAVELERQFGPRTWFRPVAFGRRSGIPLREEF